MGSRDYKATVAAELHVGNVVLVPRKCSNLFSGLAVPYPCRAVERARGDPRPVGAERDRLYHRCMSRECRDAGSISGIPEPARTVTGYRYDDLARWVEDGIAHTFGVASEYGDCRTGL